MSIEKHPVNGAYVCSDIVAGRLVRHVYYGYSKKHAMKLFRALVKATREGKA